MTTQLVLDIPQFADLGRRLLGFGPVITSDGRLMVANPHVLAPFLVDTVYAEDGSDRYLWSLRQDKLSSRSVPRIADGPVPSDTAYVKAARKLITEALQVALYIDFGSDPAYAAARRAIFAATPDPSRACVEQAQLDGYDPRATLRTIVNSIYATVPAAQ